MRKYGQVSPMFWRGETGKKLRTNHTAQSIALYLLTCPSSNMIGLYYLPLPTLCHETGWGIKGASMALRWLSDVGFAYYDEETEHVFVPNMAKFQVGESLSPGDTRIKAIEKSLEEYRKCPFFNKFLDIYAGPFLLSLSHAPSMPHRCPIDAPSMPVKQGTESREQEQEQETENTPASRARDSAPIVQRIFSCWNSHHALTTHEHLTERIRKPINARLKDGYSEADLCKAIGEYALLCQSGQAPGHNKWSLAELMSRGQGDWIDKILSGNGAIKAALPPSVSKSQIAMEETQRSMEVFLERNPPKNRALT